MGEVDLTQLVERDEAEARKEEVVPRQSVRPVGGARVPATLVGINDLGAKRKRGTSRGVARPSSSQVGYRPK